MKRQTVSRELIQDLLGEDAFEAGNLAEEFVSTVSHEFRTPLTSIKGYLDLVIEDDSLSPEEQRAYLAIVENNVNRLVRLLNDFLDLSHIASGTIPIVMQPLALNQIFLEVEQDLTTEFHANGVRLNINVADNSLFIISDRACLIRVLSNLLSNACKYTPRGGLVTVHACLDSGKITIEVADNGIGIPEEEQPKVFTRFFRGSNSERQRAKGTGLGLAITNSLVGLLGGNITFSSKVEVGTTFRIFLPVTQDQQNGEERALTSGSLTPEVG